MKTHRSAFYGILTALAVLVMLGSTMLTQAQRTDTPEAPPAPSDAPIPTAPTLTLNGTNVVQERFDSAVAWNRIDDTIIREYYAQWAVDQGVLRLNQPEAGPNLDPAIYLMPDSIQGDVSVAAQFYPQGNQAIGLVFAHSDDGYYSFRVFADSSDLAYRYTLDRIDANGLTRLAEAKKDTSTGYQYNQWQTLRVERTGSTIRAFFGERLIFDVDDAVLGKGHVGVYAVNMGDVAIDNFTVAR